MPVTQGLILREPQTHSPQCHAAFIPQGFCYSVARLLFTDGSAYLNNLKNIKPTNQPTTTNKQTENHPVICKIPQENVTW